MAKALVAKAPPLVAKAPPLVAKAPPFVANAPALVVKAPAPVVPPVQPMIFTPENRMPEGKGVANGIEMKLLGGPSSEGSESGSKKCM